ncbi:MAG: SCO1664 family protein [Actinomycetes bacterium]
MTVTNDPVDPRRLLLTGEITVQGRMPWSSNGTFLIEARLGDAKGQAVYKPYRGERPLWDFPGGLYRREVAAFVLSDALGWDIIPLTIIRDDGPMGEGSLQQFVDADFEQHYFTLYENSSNHEQLRTMCVFDLLANNTDRKSGHCLVQSDGRIFGIDNGLSFHEEFKLRTVIWEFAGESIPDRLLDDIARLIEIGLPSALSDLISEGEREALLDRAAAVLADQTFPTDPTGRRYPWPLV